jgi:hypothetical protein
LKAKNLEGDDDMAQPRVGAQRRNEGDRKYGGVEPPVRFPSRGATTGGGGNHGEPSDGGEEYHQGANDTKAASLQLSEMAAKLQAAVAKFTF